MDTVSRQIILVDTGVGVVFKDFRPDQLFQPFFEDFFHGFVLHHFFEEVGRGLTQFNLQFYCGQP